MPRDVVSEQRRVCNAWTVIYGLDRQCYMVFVLGREYMYWCKGAYYIGNYHSGKQY